MRARMMASVAAIAAALVTGGCGSKDSATATEQLTGGQKVEAIASTLQACSYDGRPVEAQPAALSGVAPGDCVNAVKRVMSYTGLPANFVVVSGPVSNAAAVILLDQNRVPRRVIAFNPDFMKAAQAQVGGSPWGAISVMAHEIAHHLSGHTIVPGGSRPEIELEADKFSGFVLQKMGAPLAAATQMILAVGTNHGTPTHPDKQRRAEAIGKGGSNPARRQAARLAAGHRPAPPPRCRRPAPRRKRRRHPAARHPLAACRQRRGTRAARAGLDPVQIRALRHRRDGQARSHPRRGDRRAALCAGEGCRSRVRDPRRQRPAWAERGRIMPGR